jgi:endonuclease-3
MHIPTIVRVLRKATVHFPRPLIDTLIQERGKDPYMILIACLLSLRARDTTTIHVCRKLFANVATPKELLQIPLPQLERMIYETGFYHNKARTLRYVSTMLLKRYDGKVPQNEEVLLSIKGIGLKTAHLVMGYAFGIPALCVDTHVHRISNRLGLVKTKTPEQTEAALQVVIPKRYWTIWNSLLVMWGQQICLPRKPRCSQCALFKWCARCGVTSWQ